MTMPYQDNPMPYELAVTCTDCGHEALFVFMECAKIRLNKDIDYFECSPLFEHQKIMYDGVGVNLACYYHKLHQNTLPDIDDLLDGYSVADWGQRYRYGFMYGLKTGSMVCQSCGLRRKHVLSWPQDAYFTIDYKGQTLWAYDRSHAVELLDYIRSKNRDRTKYKHRSFLLHLPSHFQAQKARDHITKRLSEKLLPST